LIIRLHGSFHDQYLKKFGENLKKIREAKGISQRALATSCNVDHSHISRIEKGKRILLFLPCLELAGALEVKPRKLLDFEIE
jgi:transcriptional regulator with XRE-family HTH domain